MGALGFSMLRVLAAVLEERGCGCGECGHVGRYLMGLHYDRQLRSTGAERSSGDDGDECEAGNCGSGQIGGAQGWGLVHLVDGGGEGHLDEGPLVDFQDALTKFNGELRRGIDMDYHSSDNTISCFRIP